MSAHFGKIFLALLATSLITLGVSGCQFFGKQAPVLAPVPGQLGNGTSIIGSWSASYSDISTSDTPDTANTTTFAFDGTGGLQVTSKDARLGGITCVGSGQYRLNGANDLMLYVQAVAPATCLMFSQLEFSNVAVTAQFMAYVDPSTGNEYRLVPDRAQTSPPVGVWNFGGAGGIDYIFLDVHGYFVMQTTIDAVPYLLQGYYNISGGGISLYYYNNGDPSQILGSTVFDSYLTNGQVLELHQTTSTGDVAIDGTIL